MFSFSNAQWLGIWDWQWTSNREIKCLIISHRVATDWKDVWIIYSQCKQTKQQTQQIRTSTHLGAGAATVDKALGCGFWAISLSPVYHTITVTTLLKQGSEIFFHEKPCCKILLALLAI